LDKIVISTKLGVLRSSTAVLLRVFYSPKNHVYFNDKNATYHCTSNTEMATRFNLVEITAHFRNAMSDKLIDLFDELQEKYEGKLYLYYRKEGLSRVVYEKLCRINKNRNNTSFRQGGLNCPI